MSAFSELDWRRFDVWAVVEAEGVAPVERAHREVCLAWLQRHEYPVTSIDFGQGIGPAVTALGERLQWEEQFGYRLGPERCNLNALWDGFDFELQPGQGHVLELLNAEIAAREDPDWLYGLLAIARDYSRHELALGARFFALLIIDRDSPLIGARYHTLSVPVPFRSTAAHNPFAKPPVG